MDLAHMIVKESRKIHEDEENQKKLHFELSIAQEEKTYKYSIIIGNHKIAGKIPGKNNKIYIEHNNIRFISAKNGHATRRNLKAILSQILRQYIKDSSNEVICDDEVRIKFTYKDKVIFEDTHFVEGDIVPEAISMSPNAEHDRDVCQLLNFLFVYFEMFLDAEFS